ncbi:MAG: hypothetical protein QOF89_1052 [Acidobacteriota bacterium]|jgi:hypothetical protein|nr:hypothetical protein [Acidobacteriota bacterium]
MPVNLRDLFLHLQKDLATRLQSSRAILEHGPTVGTATEEGWRRMLEDYLPQRYRVSKGFVIDAAGGLSHEIDLVIHDRQYSPFLLNLNHALYIPAESVYAVFEVKQDLSARTVDYAIAKAASVRSLKRTSVKIEHAGGTFLPRTPFPILAGLLCLDSTWTPPLGQPLADRLGASAEDGRLDLLCALGHGTAEVTYPAPKPAHLDLSTADSALIFFFLRLLERLQSLGTVPAMDLREYGRALER